MNESLYHHGIKGMHWGIRRTPQQLGYDTASTRNAKIKTMSDEELSKSVRRGELEKKYKQQNKSYEDVQSELSKDIQTASSATSNSMRKFGDMFKDKTNTEDLSKYSDTELRNRINRLNMERQYRDLTTKPSNVKKAMQTGATVVELVGGLTAAAVGISTLYNRHFKK